MSETPSSDWLLKRLRNRAREAEAEAAKWRKSLRELIKAYDELYERYAELAYKENACRCGVDE